MKFGFNLTRMRGGCVKIHLSLVVKTIGLQVIITTTVYDFIVIVMSGWRLVYILCVMLQVA